MNEEKQSLIQQYFQDILNRGNVAAASELLARDVTFHGMQIIQGIEDFMQYVLELHTAFPDLTFIVEDEVNDGRKAAARFTLRGRHRGNFLGMTATNNRVEVRGIDMFQIIDGRIKEIWDSIDSLGFVQQIGAMPSQESSRTK
jgi:steroid delta-isomerase-like uncharacterized protein